MTAEPGPQLPGARVRLPRGMPRRPFRMPVTALGSMASFALLAAGIAAQTAPRVATTASAHPAGTAPTGTAPCLVGHFGGRLERVRVRADGAAMLSVLVAPVRQGFDPGDVVRVTDPVTKAVLATGRVGVETRAAADRLHVVVDFDPADAAQRLVALAPHGRRDFPADVAERAGFVLAHGPEVTIVAPYQPERGDRLADFVHVAGPGGEGPAQDPTCVAPQCSFTLRFDRAIDVATLRRVRLLMPAGDARTESELPLRVHAADATGTVFRYEPPMGLPFLPDMQAAGRARPVGEIEPQFLLRFDDEDGGLRAADGSRLQISEELPVAIDPEAPLNLVGTRVWRLP